MIEQVLESINGNSQYIIAVIVASILAMVVTFVVNMLTKRLKFLKYIPGLILIVVGMFSLIIVLNNLFDRSSLPNIGITLITLTAGICAILFAICIGIYNKDRYPTDSKKEHPEDL